VRRESIEAKPLHRNPHTRRAFTAAADNKGAAAMAKGQAKSNKEARKPKAKKEKTIAANPSTKGSAKRED
jgi:hypothetical protein